MNINYYGYTVACREVLLGMIPEGLNTNCAKYL